MLGVGQQKRLQKGGKWASRDSHSVFFVLGAHIPTGPAARAFRNLVKIRIDKHVESSGSSANLLKSVVKTKGRSLCCKFGEELATMPTYVKKYGYNGHLCSKRRP